MKNLMSNTLRKSADFIDMHICSALCVIQKMANSNSFIFLVFPSKN